MTIPDKEFRQLANEVAEMRGALKALKWLAACLFGVVGAALIAAITWGYNTGARVGKIEQALQQSGTNIVAQITSPKSAEQLNATLLTVTAQVATAKAEGKAPDPKKIQPIADALSKVVKDNPTLPHAWEAAVEVVDYRFQPSSKEVSSLPDCLNLAQNRPLSTEIQTQKPDGTLSHEPAPGKITARIWAGMVVAQNCRLDLDDNGTFEVSKAAKSFEDEKKREPRISYFILEISNAFITYKGGKLLPISEIRFRNCSFHIEPAIGVPDMRRQSITRQLLEAKSENGSLQLAAGM